MTKTEIAKRLYEAYCRVLVFPYKWEELSKEQVDGWLNVAAESNTLNGNSTPPRIHEVSTEGDESGMSVKTLGYCTGNSTDIQNYFNDQKLYRIRLREIKVSHISAADVKEKQELIKRKMQLELELKEINNKLQ
jgi:hypothetical protein